MTSQQSPIERALIVLALRGDPPVKGHVLVRLRAQVLAGDYPDHPAAREADSVQRRIDAVEVDGMPPPADLMAILIEALSQQLGGVGYDQAWQSIGVNPGSGRDLLKRHRKAVTWPVWRTLRDAALERT